jgi:hypothetical protein
MNGLGGMASRKDRAPILWDGVVPRQDHGAIANQHPVSNRNPPIGCNEHIEGQVDIVSHDEISTCHDPDTGIEGDPFPDSGTCKSKQQGLEETKKVEARQCEDGSTDCLEGDDQR